jgi:hypothetical protein
MTNLIKLSKLALFALAVASFSSCTKDVVAPEKLDDLNATVARASYSSRTVNWDNRADGTYTSSAAASDFGNIGGWVDSRGYISSHTCRVTLLANALSGAGGIVSTISIPTGQQYELQFDVKFHSSFDWSQGGKVGFGFGIGYGYAGGTPGWDGNGGSLRLMWYNNNGSVYFQPYVYYKDQPGQYGNDFGKRSYISKGTWYTVYMFAQSNTGSSTNGWVTIKVNGTSLINQSIRWTTNDANRLINSLWFMTFRGGSSSDWQSSSTCYIYYDNLWWKKDS